MFGEGSVACFTGNIGVFACGLQRSLVGVAGFAGLVPGKKGRPRRNVPNRGRTIVPVLSKRFRNDGGAHREKCEATDQEDKCDANKMTRVVRRHMRSA